MAKSELQKLIDGEWYRVDDSEVAARKLNSATRRQEFNAILKCNRKVRQS